MASSRIHGPGSFVTFSIWANSVVWKITVCLTVRGPPGNFALPILRFFFFDMGQIYVSFTLRVTFGSNLESF
jgi:hypothetical protein